IFHGCVCFGTGASLEYTSHGSSRQSQKTCKKRYGFVPKEGTAYNVYTSKTGRRIRKRVDTDMVYSDYPDPKNGRKYTLREAKEGCIKEIIGKRISTQRTREALDAIKALKWKDLFDHPAPSLVSAFAWGEHEMEHDLRSSFWSNISCAKWKKEHQE
ncbi:MAG: hypothetical protein ACTSSP_11525, partial [Candidatus Asgardarchaeia archaeon]